MTSPDTSISQVRHILVESYGICEENIMKISSLGSCQDCNYKIVTCKDNVHDIFLLKVSNTSVTYDQLLFENQVLSFLHASFNQMTNKSYFSNNKIDIPQVIEASTASDAIVQYTDVNGTCYFVRLLTYIHGNMLSDSKYLSIDELISYGILIAELDNIMTAFQITPPISYKQWDMQNVMMIVDNYDVKYQLSNHDSFAKTLVDKAHEMNRIISELSSKFTKQIIHGDLAWYNIIAQRMDNGRSKISGVIDFGDVCESWTIGNLAIAITPCLVLEHKQPHIIAKHVLQGYLMSRSLCKEEIASLWPLIVQRSIVLYLGIFHQLQEDPMNQYCQDEFVLNEKIVKNVMNIPFQFAQETMLQAAHLSTASTYPCSPLILFPSSLFKHVDLGVQSSVYLNGNWLTTSEIEDFVHDNTQKHAFDENGNLNNPTEILVVPYGIPHLLRSQVHSHVPPSSIPLSTTFYSRTSISLIVERSSNIVVEIINNNSKDDNRIVLSNDHHSVVISGRFLYQCDSTPNMIVTCSKEKSLYHSLRVQLVTYPVGNLNQCPPEYCSDVDFSAWKALCPNPLSYLGIQISDCNDSSITDSALQLRYEYFASVQQHYFRTPPVFVRGYRQYMYDQFGRCYLDMVNNVAVVGHSHEDITAVASRQLGLLNTNSRFVYEILGKFTERIINTIPLRIRENGKLNTVLLVNSGSEATDLALRIARTVVTARRRNNITNKMNNCVSTMNRDVICLQGAYHGVTTASDEVSTTLNDNPRSLETRAPWIHLVPMPNMYRGVYQLDSGSNTSVESIANQYVGLVRDKITELIQKGSPPSCFIAEPLSGNAGGVELPYGYLQGVYKAIHDIGGLCICDEVQVGYGRTGKTFWCYESHDIVPDILTMAKAAGNGFPLGFVITSKDIIEEFGEEEGSFFSSAGGSPLSCAIGMKVLDIIEQERLQENALIVGKYLNEKLKLLQQKYPEIIGCIHGHGLYQGIELIDDVINKTPATAKAYAICERLLELGVICHNTGDYSNVLKVKPPLYFNAKDADFFVNALDITLGFGW